MGFEFRKRWKAFASATTFHGVNDFVTAENKVLKGIWATIMIVSVGLLIYQLALLFKLYMNCPTSFQSSIIPTTKFPPIRVYAQSFLNYTNFVNEAKGNGGEFMYRMGYFWGWEFDCSGAMMAEGYDSGYNMPALMSKYAKSFVAADATNPPASDCSGDFGVSSPGMSFFTPKGAAAMADSVAGMSIFSPMASKVEGSNQMTTSIKYLGNAEVLGKWFQNATNRPINKEAQEQGKSKIESQVETEQVDFYKYFDNLRLDAEELIGLDSSVSGIGVQIDRMPVIDEFGISYQINAQIKEDGENDELNSLDASFAFYTPYRMMYPAFVRHSRLEKPTGLFPIPVGYIVTFGTELIDKVKWFVPKPNTDYTIIMNPRVRKFINSKLNPCSPDSKVVLKKCMQECKIIIEECKHNCTYFRHPNQTAKGRWCNQFRISQEKLLVKSSEAHCNQAGKECYGGCKLPCENWDYNLQIIEGNTVVPNLSVSLDPWNFPINYFRISMAQAWRAEMVEEYYVYTISSFLSNIGGLFGLFVGASMISFFHIIFFWCCKLKVKHDDELAE